MYYYNSNRYLTIQNITSLNSNCSLLICIESAVSRPSSSADLGWVCTRDGWLAVGWLSSAPHGLSSSRPAMTTSHGSGRTARAKVETQEDSWGPDAESYNPFNHMLLSKTMYRSSPDSRDGEIVFTPVVRERERSPGEWTESGEGKILGKLIHLTYPVCLFSHLTLNMRTSCAALSIIQYSCLQNSHSHFRQLRL